ncbi:MAG TPA: orotate phosphoribosyltransferase [Actinomycetota bacterium]|nr:orotate phosphoribosyltransferase [Actinomycetota bacterium]
MTPEEAARLLERHGAILRGHFKLSSGRHSDVYVEKARILEQPEATTAVGRAIASWYPQVEVVVAPAVGAIVLGFAVALAGGARSIYAEREGDRMRLRRGFRVAPGERALVVEDVVTTGGSAREVFDLLDETGAERLGVAALVDRTTGPVPFPFRALVRIEASSWEPAECPLCREGRSFDSPGSRHLERSG